MRRNSTGQNGGARSAWAAWLVVAWLGWGDVALAQDADDEAVTPAPEAPADAESVDAEEPAEGTAERSAPDAPQDASAPADAAPAASAASESDAPAAPAAPVEAERPANAASSVRATGAGAEYDLRLRELEDRMGELKEDIFRSRSRLFLLREQILQQGVRGSRVVINHLNEMSRNFDVRRVVYSLDGTMLLSASAEAVDLSRTVPVFTGVTLPGPHNVSVEMRLRGNRRGFFSYMEGYEFTVRSSCTFIVEEGQTVKLDIALIDRGRRAESLEERPSVDCRYEYSVTALDDDQVSALENSP